MQRFGANPANRRVPTRVGGHAGPAELLPITAGGAVQHLLVPAPARQPGPGGHGAYHGRRHLPGHAPRDVNTGLSWFPAAPT
ncbi:hypothetical protein G6F62_015940 [Rhizopus arrhizus]|nr:hypothetical protein G6F62_015940 [Rhizopus arrhizus]